MPCSPRSKTRRIGSAPTSPARRDQRRGGSARRRLVSPVPLRGRQALDELLETDYPERWPSVFTSVCGRQSRCSFVRPAQAVQISLASPAIDWPVARTSSSRGLDLDHEIWQIHSEGDRKAIEVHHPDIAPAAQIGRAS